MILFIRESGLRATDGRGINLFELDTDTDGLTIFRKRRQRGWDLSIPSLNLKLRNVNRIECFNSNQIIKDVEEMFQ